MKSISNKIFFTGLIFLLIFSSSIFSEEINLEKSNKTQFEILEDDDAVLKIKNTIASFTYKRY